VSSQHLRGLTPGSLGIDRFQDLSDIQWATWRSNFPLLCFALGVFVLLSQLLRKRFLVPWSEASSSSLPSSSFGSVEEVSSPPPPPSAGALIANLVRKFDNSSFFPLSFLHTVTFFCSASHLSSRSPNVLLCNSWSGSDILPPLLGCSLVIFGVDSQLHNCTFSSRPFFTSLSHLALQR
jgi:hypothetical protein